MSTVRPVYLAGETFEAAVKAFDAEGKPVRQKLQLKVFERTTVNGQVGERLVEQRPVETASDGAVRQTLVLKKGGDYVVRAEGIDRFQNAVTGQCGVQISGDDDTVRLRILADSHRYKVGDTAAVKIHWREKPALGLVTFQGARVLDYRLVELKTGENDLRIPMTPALAPNFDLSVAVMRDEERGSRSAEQNTKRPATAVAGAPRVQTEPSARPHPNPILMGEGTKRPIVRFHEANSPFDVVRDLQVKVVVKRKDANAGKAAGDQPPRPGDEVEITVTAADAQGKPVAAEVSLGLVEQSLLDRFPNRTAAIHDFFQLGRRRTAIETTSSITFAYHPTTQPINPQLLAEEDRLALAAEEEASRRAAATAAGGGQFGGQAGGRGRRGAQPAPVATTEVSEPETEQGEGPEAESQLNPHGGASKRHVAHGPGGMRVKPHFPSPASANRSPDHCETAYWNPTIVTGKDGRATVALTLPEDSTAWRVLAKGITTDTLAGEADEKLIVKKELFGELKLPPCFTVGDHLQPIASIHNAVVEKGPIFVTLKTVVGRGTFVQQKMLFADAKGVQRRPIPRLRHRSGRSAVDRGANGRFYADRQGRGPRRRRAALRCVAAFRRDGPCRGRRRGRLGHERLDRAAAGHGLRQSDVVDLGRTDDRAEPLGRAAGAAAGVSTRNRSHRLRFGDGRERFDGGRRIAEDARRRRIGRDDARA